MEQDNSSGYAALRRAAGLVDRSAFGRILLTGADRRSYLQGLLTNDIMALGAGEGCYAALLNAQGRMMADMRVLELGDAVLLDVVPQVTEPVRAHLERFVFSEEVEVRDVTAERAEIGAYGPAAASIVSGVLKVAVAELPLFGNLRASFNGSPAIVVRSDEIGIDGFDIIVDRGASDGLMAALSDRGAVPASDGEVDTLRIESGRPLFGVDMTEETIPLEAGIDDRAISRTKGCYVGQEVIVRVLDRGHGRVARRLVGLALPAGAPLPAAGAAIAAGDKEVGRITSRTMSPALGHPIALGYVHRDFVVPGTTVTVGGVPAVVAALPFAAPA